jgi:hypothetical protein
MSSLNRGSSGLERIGRRLMLNRDPMVGGKFADDPFPAKSADAAVLFAAKRSRGRIMNAVIVYVRHASLKFQRELNATFAIFCEHGA